jgi:histidinol-phosphatase
MTLTVELEFATALADIADDISMHYWRRADTAIRSKGDGTPVTAADEEIERVLRKEIASAFPEHGVLGEEEAELRGASGAKWILDPIDGTKNFAWGIPVWATLIALEVDGEIRCGVASAPALRERYAAARTLGATRNGDPISVSETSSLSAARVGFTSIETFMEQGFTQQFMRYVSTAKHDRGIGDFYGHMLVACGALDAMVEPRLNAWDLGPLIVIVEEAGGRFSDIGGVRHIYGQSAVSSNGVVHDAVLEVFASGVGGAKGR